MSDPRKPPADDPRVVVVGGGVTGVGVARDLALRGLDVTLIERDRLAAGTTGRSHGLLHSGARYAEDDPDGARACIEESRSLRSIAGACVRETGGLFVRMAGDDPDYLERKLAACREVGIDADPLSGERAREAVPALAEGVERAIRVPDAVVYPSRLTAATAADAREHGATVRTGAPVTDIAVEEGQVTGVRVDDDVLRADHVVNAAGAWAPQIAGMADCTVGMDPTRGAMVVVECEGLCRVVNRCREPADGDIAVPHDDRVVLGTTSVAVEDPDDYPREDREVGAVLDEAAAMVPSVAEAPAVRTYWGVRPLFSPNQGEGRAISRDFALLDHADRDGRPGLSTIVGGKLTTYRRMAEATADLVCDRLGVEAACRTADRPLPAADDPGRLDELVAEFGGPHPADADAVDAD